jgi:GNAT superfamily N-acetyltransferase
MRPDPPTGFTVRPARQDEIPRLLELIRRSARELSVGFYSPEETEAAIRYVFGVDSTLVDDGSYLVVEEGPNLVGCGGWSSRRTLYGGDQRPMGAGERLTPGIDAARIRAFFVAPEHARRGIGRLLLQHCESAARAAGYTRLELMATLPGVPLYAAFGFQTTETVTDVLPDGTPLRFVRMARPVAHEAG